MASSSRLLVVASALLLALAGCSADGPASSSGNAPGTSVPSNASSVPTPDASATPTAASDVCDLLPLARVVDLTGVDYTSAYPVTSGHSTTAPSDEAECEYINGATAADSDAQVDVAVVGKADKTAVYDQQKSFWGDGDDSYKEFKEGLRAFSTDSVVTVEFKTVTIIANDGASTGDVLEVDQLRFLVDEVASKLGAK